MKTIMIMFDSLNRRFLQPYGCPETITPNFLRLARHTVQFDRCYAASLPCIPARRELHTGRYNFLHRSWGPLEPFDDSMPRILRENGIHSHLVSDHGHYWECGGATYHTQYSTWEIIRGEEGDSWQAVVGEIEDTDPNLFCFTDEMRNRLYQQNLANRTSITVKDDYPLVKTFDASLDFLRRNAAKDSWFLQIESFSPHEPFMACEEFKRLYSVKYLGKRFEWPDYAPVQQTEEEIEQVRYAYFAALSMCDEQLGRILDWMDQNDAWKDTMLIVNTDHGYLLGEHGYWAKNYMPCYDEIAHIPLFIWDPRFPKIRQVHRQSLVQTIDLPVTILDFFGINPTKDMQGIALSEVIKQDTSIREYGLFGIFGAHVCCTDGRYVYMRSPRNEEIPLYEYTLMPTHMMDFFSAQELCTMQRNESLSFTKDLPVMRIQTDSSIRCVDKHDYLFDLKCDPEQKKPIQSPDITALMKRQMRLLMIKNDAGQELLSRFGLDKIE